MTSTLWRQTGGIWPLGVSCSLTWYDVGAIAHILQAARIGAVLEVGVEHGGLSAFFLAYAASADREIAYRGIDISLGALSPVVRQHAGARFIETDAWDARTIADAGAWLHRHDAPALIFCDGGDKPKELKLYAPLLRPGDVLLGHDYHNEYVDDAIRDVAAMRVRPDWLDDTLLCMFVRGDA